MRAAPHASEHPATGITKHGTTRETLRPSFATPASAHTSAHKPLRDCRKHNASATQSSTSSAHCMRTVFEDEYNML